jgi:hypothetical protein
MAPWSWKLATAPARAIAILRGFANVLAYQGRLFSFSWTNLAILRSRAVRQPVPFVRWMKNSALVTALILLANSRLGRKGAGNVDKLQFVAGFRHSPAAESHDKLKFVGHFWIRQQYPPYRKDTCRIAPKGRRMPTYRRRTLRHSPSAPVVTILSLIVTPNFPYL